MNKREALAYVHILQVSVFGPLAGRRAVGEVVRREVIQLVRVVQQIIARVDAGMKMGVDKPRRDKAAFGVDFFVDGL